MFSYKGFTLVELMIVIAIIGILGAALFPSLGNYFVRARNTQRISDLRNLNTAFKAYYIDHDATPPNSAGSTEFGQCINVGSGGRCWNGYSFNPDVVAWKGRTGSILGSTIFDDIMRTYLINLPSDPSATRTVGDRYIFSSSAGDIHCDGSQTVWAGGWLIWQPEKISPITDIACLGQGQWGCCSGVGCGSHNFCLIRVDV